MIPYGQNPMGLETRPIRFIARKCTVYESGAPTIEYQRDITVDDRMFCYVTFPQELVRDYGPMWGISDGINFPTTPLAWMRWPKKYSRDNIEHQNDEERVMIEQEFSSTTPLILFHDTWIDTAVPKFGTVFVLDTSGSMDGTDYTKAKKSITMSVMNAANQCVDGAKIWLYPGTYVRNIVEMKAFGSVNLSALAKSGGSAIMPYSSALVDSAKKNSSSEAMVTCMYYAMDDVFNELHLDTEPGNDKYFDPYENKTIQGMSFIMLTDESVITDDTLQDVSKMKNGSKWWKDFNDHANVDCKFPTGLNSNGKAMSASKFCGRVNHGCIQLSYFLGVNVTWAMTTMLSSSGDINQLKVSSKKPGVIPFTGEADDQGNVATGAKSWYMPTTYHVEYPYVAMSMIVLSGITACTLVQNDRKLRDLRSTSERDANKSRAQVSMKDVLRSHEDESLGGYVAFCFRYFAKDSFILPMPDQVTGNGVTLYKWGRVGREGNVVELYWPGANYVPQTTHTRELDGRRIIFKLMYQITVTFCKCDSGDGSDGNTFANTYVANYDKVRAPSNPSREGFTFDGWYTAKDGGTKVTAWNIPYSTNKKYYAHWTPVPPAP